MRHDDRQLELPLANRKPAPALRVIKGEGKTRPDPLVNRDAVARVLVGAGVDLLLKRISPERAEAIEVQVNEALDLFDRVDRDPSAQPKLQAVLDELERLVRQSAEVRLRRQI